MSKEVKPFAFRRLVNDQVPSTTYVTHGIYYYPAKFIPQVARYVIMNYSKEGEWVEDPFAGSGTTCVESLITGRNCLAIDINPFTELLVKVKTLELPARINKAAREIRVALGKAARYRGEPFRPSWSRALYWYRQDVFEELCRLWGFVHSLSKEYVRLILSIALLKVSRKFSFTDDQIPKMYKSKVKATIIKALLAGDWRKRMIKMFENEALRAFRKVAELNKIIKNRKRPEIRVITGVDAVSKDPPLRADVVVTSPPYLIAHEYFRSTKLELYWLGFSEKDVRELTKYEIPYNRPPPISINSRTFHEYRKLVASRKPHLIKYYDTYFKSVLAALQRHAPRSDGTLAVFIGPATLAGIPIPAHKIIQEHLESLGFKHIETLDDAITSRKMFRKRRNENPNGITHEYLLVMKAP